MDSLPSTPKRPMASVRCLSLFRREIKESVSPAALEALLGNAGRISEGQLSAEGHYFGSTILTIELHELAAQLRDACDVATSSKLAEHLATEPLMLERGRQIALEEAGRIASCSLHVLGSELRVRSEGTRICIDIDLEGELVSSPAQSRCSSR